MPSPSTSASPPTTSNPPTFDTLYAGLQTHPAPLLPRGRARDPQLTAAISSLSLHPALETALHLLNLDLPSAHFLVRHMQAAPAYEGMYLHGILHRIEGDYDNARAWYGDVADSDVFRKVWRSGDEGRAFVGRVEAWKKRGEGDGKELEEESRRELGAVVDWCVERFGKGEWRDASSVWVQPREDIKKTGEEMVSGGKGFREF